MDPRMDPQLYAEALAFAERAHRGQRRKGSEVPYITHPVAVSGILAQYEVEPEIVIAGLLHDVVEDAGVSLGELRLLFGARVAALVAEVSEEKRRDGRAVSWEERKEAGLAHLQEAAVEVVALKAADVLHNLESVARDLRLSGPGMWSRFNRGEEQQLRYYRRLAGVIGERLGDHPLAREVLEAAAKLEETARRFSNGTSNR